MGFWCKWCVLKKKSQKQVGPELRPMWWLGMKEGRWRAESCCKRFPGVHIPMGECYLDFGFRARPTPHPAAVEIPIGIYVFMYIYLFIYLFIYLIYIK